MRRVLLAVATTTGTILASTSFAQQPFFFCAGATCNFISTPFLQSHLRLRRRRILIGNLYRTTSLFSFPATLFRPTGSLTEADMEMGEGDGPYESFALVLLLFCLPPGNRQCIFYNAAMFRWPGVVCRSRLASSETLLAAATTIFGEAV